MRRTSIAISVVMFALATNAFAQLYLSIDEAECALHLTNTDPGLLHVVDVTDDLKQPWVPFFACFPAGTMLDIPDVMALDRAFFIARISETAYEPPDMTLIPGGWFAMGDENETNSAVQPIHLVRIDPLFMDTTETANEEISTVYNWAQLNGFPIIYPNNSIEDPVILQQDEFLRPLVSCGIANSDLMYSPFYPIGLFPNTPANQTLPVRTITWLGAIAYCNYRSLIDELAPCYDLTSGTCDFSQNGYRLPTEAEWEKAARGGMTRQHFPWKNPAGDYRDCIDASLACYASTSSVTVAHYLANGYGLFDMAGNTREWCNDWFQEDAYIEETTADNPKGPASGTQKVLRGGSWEDAAEPLLCAWRSAAEPEVLDRTVGFRCVRRITQEPWIVLKGQPEMDLLLNTPYTDPGYTAYDFQDGDLSTNVVVGNTVDPSTLGTYVNTYDVQDSTGYAATRRTRTLHVTLGYPPAIYLSYPYQMVLSLGTPYEEPGYSSYDSEDGLLTEQVIVTGTVDPTTQGLYVLTYAVTDSHGNTASKHRYVSISIGNPPKVSLPSGTTLLLDMGEEFVEPDFYAQDDEDGDLTAVVTVSGTVDTSVRGSSELVYTVIDSDGNPSVPVVLQVIVEDRSPPNLLLTRGPTVPWDLGEPFTEPGWSAIDNVDGDLAAEVVVAGSVDTSVEGVYVLTYQVSDSTGNTIRRARYLNVMDRLPAPSGMVRIPAGSFSMGDHKNLVYPGIQGAFGNAPWDEENWDLPVHDVYVSDFFMVKYEVIEAEFCAALDYFLAQNQVRLSADLVEVSAWDVDLYIGTSVLRVGKIQRSQVVSESPLHVVPIPGTAQWPTTPGTATAVALCANYKSIQDGFDPCYDLSAYPPTVDLSKNGYRAPTEAEWEKAARGGLEAMHYPWGGAGDLWGDGVFRSDLLAISQLEDVGSHPPNGYGIYDMAGNAIEFCVDTFVDDAYTQAWATTPDPVFLNSSLTTPYVLRGGPYSDTFDERTFRCCARFKQSDLVYYPRGGIRLVRRPLP